MLDRITPLVLTYNEEANIGRTLECLTWAKRIVVVDSFSTDRTLEIVRGFTAAHVVQHAFDAHAEQWNRGLAQVDTEWVLALDADYLLSPELVEELRTLAPDDGVSGYRARFVYCVHGKPLRGSLYPPVVVLFRREGARYEQDGHTQRIRTATQDVRDLANPILHDDRKPFSRWWWAQQRYAEAEARKLASASWRELRWPDRVRKVPFASGPLVFAHCMLGKRCLLDGRAGLVYASQRLIAESLISARLISRRGSSS
jgi:glycosyltransferase involved in cell wall biosynthesis